ncbi:MAG: T9SS C-terminal target domain-containing protein [Flavobacteriales bacterium]|nr:T9SS C-terminal target domain-containing protein [Crocinitomicaceae bacterium]NBX80010.1 T9SS C-terminal target domain-containing protein [Flavobacteriales bacterium]NCA19569.1 T9SS C-terminal target domain-containing protein [Crocinitomicaceae bacterium]
MKIVSIIFSLALSGSLFSQITLNGVDFASANDTIRISQTMDPVIDYTLTGSNFTWDFSGLTATSQFLKYYQPISNSTLLVQVEFGFNAPTVYKASYFLESRDIPIDQLNQFLPAELSDLNAFSRKNNDSITSVGYSISVNGEALPFKSDTIETRYKYPMNFGDSFSSRGYTFIDLNPVTDFKLKQHRFRTTVVDGFGTLISPAGTFEVLRLKSVIEESDSIYQTFFGGGIWTALPLTTTTEYEWWAQGKDDALLKIVATDNNGTSQIRSVEYKDIYLGLDAGVTENDFAFSIAPNPISDELNVVSDSEINSIVIKGTEGNVVLESKEVGKSANVNVSTLNSGVYFISLYSGSSVSTRKIIKL